MDKKYQAWLKQIEPPRARIKPPEDLLPHTHNGNHAFIADHTSGLQVIDVSNVAAPFLVSSFNTPGLVYSIAVADNYAYIANDSSGLLIIDVSNPANPILISVPIICNPNRY